MEKSVSLFNLRNLENVLQRNLRTGMARECIFRASGGTRFKNFCKRWWRKGGGGTPRCNQSAEKNSIRHCNYYADLLFSLPVPVTILYIIFLHLLLLHSYEKDRLILV